VTATRRWLVDKSAPRPHLAVFADVLVPRIAAGRVSICVLTELEVVYSARSRADHERIERDVLASLTRVIMSVAAETRAREIQAVLVARGQHRAVAIPDLMVAAVAQVEGFTVQRSPWAVDLCPMLNPQHDHPTRGTVDAVEDALRAPARRVATFQLAAQLLADALGILQQRGDELDDGTRDGFGQAVWIMRAAGPATVSSYGCSVTIAAAGCGPPRLPAPRRRWQRPPRPPTVPFRAFGSPRISSVSSSAARSSYPMSTAAG